MAPPAMVYVEAPDCPEGMTLAQWRAARVERRRRGLLHRLAPGRRRATTRPAA